VKNTKKILRSVIYQALNNTVTVNSVTYPVFDEAKHVTSTADVFMLLSTQQETPRDTDDAFMTFSTIDIEVYQKTGASVSKDLIDDIEDKVLTILFPTAWTEGIVQPSLMQIQNLRRERSISRALEVSSTETIIRNIITISATIIQQQ
jgi:hypothetical protein